VVLEFSPDLGGGLYLDACATAPPRPEVLQHMAAVQRSAWANASSLHPQGLRAAEQLERSRLELAQAFEADVEEVIVTSGATESIHLALLGVARCQPPGRLVISAVEHPAVEAAASRMVERGWQIARWPVDGEGTIRLDQLEVLLAPPTRLVSLIWGQSEVGTLQPVQRVGEACRARGIPLHVDATQVVSQGRPAWSLLPVDLLSASAHKCGGPKGVGLLLRRRALGERHGPIQAGGGQEGGLRGGTQPVVLTAGMARAISLLQPWLDPQDPEADPGPSRIGAVQQRRDLLLQQLLDLAPLQRLGAPVQRLPHHIALLAADPQGRPLPGRAVVRALAAEGVAISSGSACASGRDGGSPVLAAMGIAPDWCRSGLRLSLGPWLSASDLDAVAAQVQGALERVAATSAAA
jgi:cysteine desulfurase